MSHGSRSSSLAEHRSSGRHRTIFRTNARKSALSSPSGRFSSDCSRLSLGRLVVPVQFPATYERIRVLSQFYAMGGGGGEEEAGKKSLALPVEVPPRRVTRAALQEVDGRRTEQRDHVREVVQIVAFLLLRAWPPAGRLEHVLALEHVPDLRLGTKPSQQPLIIRRVDLRLRSARTMTPTAQMSTFSSHGAPRMTSGARYWYGWMSPVYVSVPISRLNRASPKSQSTGRP